MKKLKIALADKHGWSYILTCAVILFAVALISIVMQYTYVYHIASEQKSETQLKLDNYVTSCAIKNYNALKQGESYGEYIDRSELRSGAYELLGFPKLTTSEPRPEEKNEKYIMSHPNITSLANDSFGVYVEYTLTVPFEVFGQKVTDIGIPIKIISQFKEK